MSSLSSIVYLLSVLNTLLFFLGVLSATLSFQVHTWQRGCHSANFTATHPGQDRDFNIDWLIQKTDIRKQKRNSPPWRPRGVLLKKCHTLLTGPLHECPLDILLQG